MIDLIGVKHHQALEDIVDVLCAKTQNTDRGFFRAEVAYFFAKMASCMRASITTKDRGEIPVNQYALILATSGFGKGHSMSIMENDFIKQFKRRFMDETLPVIAEKTMRTRSNERAVINSSDPEDEFDKLVKEFKRAGAYPFTFDSGTPPAVKQLRHKLLLGDVGSINLQIDEIGANFTGSVDVLTLFLELYDQGQVKQKLTKNTAENERSEEVDGKTPTNLLLFGTPSKLLDGGQTEDEFYAFLEMGYARRCLFALGQQSTRAHHTQTAQQIYDKLIQPTNMASVSVWADHFHDLADPTMYGFNIQVGDAVGVRLLEYKIACERAADTMAEHEDIRKAEMSHRYFKALKLAGSYAFIEQSNDLKMEHLMQAILLVEESGTAFQSIMSREKTYVKLAKYIAAIGTEVTHADLHQALPYYKASSAARNELITLATAWGYKQHIVIKKRFEDGIELFKGETLKKTNLEEIVVAYSDHYAFNYLNEEVPFTELHNLTQQKNMHWCNHHLRGGHRAEENVQSGFNMIVVDVDGGTSMEVAKDLLKDYKFMMYSTKRSTDDENRFRLMIPINYHLQLDSDEYKEFMTNIVGWLPFVVDEAANQRARKWQTHDGEFHYNLDADVLDVLPFIPRTSKNEQYQQGYQKVQSLDNLERWFAVRIATGSRNNQMLKYALALVDSGMSLIDVSKQVHLFNAKLSNQLPEEEIDQTILNTVAKRFVPSNP